MQDYYDNEMEQDFEQFQKFLDEQENELYSSIARKCGEKW
jgi:succinate dehydrogenase flavin-adding protein (antitoxin of CptAB toxin-antitoxin module)